MSRSITSSPNLADQREQALRDGMIVAFTNQVSGEPGPAQLDVAQALSVVGPHAGELSLRAVIRVSLTSKCRATSTGGWRLPTAGRPPRNLRMPCSSACL